MKTPRNTSIAKLLVLLLTVGVVTSIIAVRNVWFVGLPENNGKASAGQAPPSALDAGGRDAALTGGPGSRPQEPTADTFDATNTVPEVAKDAQSRIFEALRNLRDDNISETVEELQAADATLLRVAEEIEKTSGTVRPAGGGGSGNDGEQSSVELAGIDDYGKPKYFTTHNVNSGISANADTLDDPPYSISTGDQIVGVWDAGSARTTHVELNGRVTASDGATVQAHSTHVAGTIAAIGVRTNARGLAPGTRIESRDWTSDVSEMTGRSAQDSTGTNAIRVSNHSYGYVVGWDGTRWWGSGTNQTAADKTFGRYSSDSQSADSLGYSRPFYLMVRSAGNDRDDGPLSGQSVYLTSTTTNTVPYDPAIHPPKDGVYKSGYDNLSGQGVSKNVLTVGAVNDAVTSGARDLTKATMSGFSSWGPTDDGRIKPDVVANGTTLTSSTSTGDTNYTSMSGTSMSAPSVSGVATLLVSRWRTDSGSYYPRASTIKAVLIHTADDLGVSGPDYSNGWGLVNAKRAVDTVDSYFQNPLLPNIQEETLSSTSATNSFSFYWDGTSPIKATLCWTDPAGTSTTTGDYRRSVLVNDLDLRIVGPDNSTNMPFVMPFTTTWASQDHSAGAVAGDNITDNVEQVFIPSPSLKGRYSVTVTHKNTLSGNSQAYSLVLSGGTSTPPPDAPSLSVPGGISFTEGASQFYGIKTDRTSILVSDYSANYIYSTRIDGPATTETTMQANGNLDVIFSQPGDYTVYVSASNQTGTSPESPVNIRLARVPASISISPTEAAVFLGGQFQFSLVCRDQFNSDMPAPASLLWTCGNWGTIDNSGLFAAGRVGLGSVTASIPGDPLSLLAPDATLMSSSTVSIRSSYDAWAEHNFGPNWVAEPESQTDADADGDGCVNWAEYHLGTDPQDPNSRFRMSAGLGNPPTPGQLEVVIGPVSPNGQVIIKQCSQLGGAWETLTTLNVTSFAEFYSVPIAAPTSQGFYKGIYIPPAP